MGWLGWEGELGGWVYTLLLRKSMYQISTSYCAWPGTLILFKFQPSQGIGLSGVLRLRMGEGGYFIIRRENYIPNLNSPIMHGSLRKVPGGGVG